MADDKNPIAKNLPDGETSENLPPFVGPYDLPKGLYDLLKLTPEQLKEREALQKARKRIDAHLGAPQRVVVVASLATSEPAKSVPARDARDTWDTKIGEGAGGVEQAPAEPKKAWRERPPEADIEAAMKDIAQDIAQQYPPGAHPGEDVIWAALKVRLKREDLPRRVAREAIEQYAPQLRGRRGYHSTKPPE
jgi:hypothetical protein